MGSLIVMLLILLFIQKYTINAYINIPKISNRNRDPIKNNPYTVLHQQTSFILNNNEFKAGFHRFITLRANRLNGDEPTPNLSSSSPSIITSRLGEMEGGVSATT